MWYGATSRKIRTNRADTLDPALLRPGRFDRRLEFELPARQARRPLVDHFLARTAHDASLDLEPRRDTIAAQTFGSTPAMIEHLFDEALVLALKDGRDELSWSDVQDARLVGQVGMKNPVDYTDRERTTGATHEAGHATVAPRRYPPAGGAVDHQAERVARPAGPRGHRRDLDPVPQGDVRPGRHRDGRHGGRGAVVLRGRDRPGRRPGRRHHRRLRDRRVQRHGGVPLRDGVTDLRVGRERGAAGRPSGDAPTERRLARPLAG